MSNSPLTADASSSPLEVELDSEQVLASNGSTSSHSTPPPPPVRRSSVNRMGSASSRGSAARDSVTGSRKRSTETKADDEEATEHVNGLALSRCSHDVLMEMVLRQQEEQLVADQRIEKLQSAAGELQRENGFLVQDFAAAKQRVDQLMADESRMEEELSGRIEVLDKLRASIRDSEREQRDVKKRYREQTESFDSERQSWYDQEEHYKLRITNMASIASRKPRAPLEPTAVVVDEVIVAAAAASEAPSVFLAEPIQRSDSSSSLAAAEIAALQDQLSSLTTAHHSLTSTSRALQVELGEIKRVYYDLQEENESYQLLLGERTLNGEVRGSELFTKSWTSDDEPETSGYGGLESVGETDEGLTEEEEDGERVVEMEGVDREAIISINVIPTGSPVRARRRKPPTRPPHRSGSVEDNSRVAAGGGFDLAAELEAAECADEQAAASSNVAAERKQKHKRDKSTGDEALRNELKALREANKALTLYVSKIVDRVCSQEGFEKVLAVDFSTPGLTYRNELDYPSPTTPMPSSSMLSSSIPSSSVRFEASATSPDPSGSSSSSRFLSRISTVATPVSSVAAPTTSSTAPTKRVSPISRLQAPARPLSLDWKSVSSVFSSALARTAAAATPTPAPISQPVGFKPLILVDSTVLGPRYLSTDEDEEDIRERERLRAEMALHGIVTSASGWGRPSIERSTSPSSSTSPSLGRLSIAIPSRRSSSTSLSPMTSPREEYPDLQFRQRSPSIRSSSARVSPVVPLTAGWEDRSGLGISGTQQQQQGLGLGLGDDYRGGSAPPSRRPSASSSILSANDSFDGASSNGRSAGGVDEAANVEEQASWTKRLKRMSMSAGWMAPALTEP